MSSLRDKLTEKLQESNAGEPIITTAVSEDSNIIPFRQQESSCKDVQILPTFAISISEAKERLLMLKKFVKEMLVPGEDFGLIPGCNKPSLLKPGAEKLCEIYGFSKHVEIINTTQDWERGVFYFEVMVTLINKRSGIVEAQGVGSANSKEKKYKGQDSFSIINTVLKICKKRALVDAVLSATRSSGIFSQDIEEMEEFKTDEPTKPTSTRVRIKASSSKIKNRDVPNEDVSSIPPLPNKTLTQYPPMTMITKEQLTQIFSPTSSLAIPIDTMKKLFQYRYFVTKSIELTQAQGDDLIKYLKSQSPSNKKRTAIK